MFNHPNVQTELIFCHGPNFMIEELERIGYPGFPSHLLVEFPLSPKTISSNHFYTVRSLFIWPPYPNQSLSHFSWPPPHKKSDVISGWSLKACQSYKVFHPLVWQCLHCNMASDFGILFFPKKNYLLALITTWGKFQFTLNDKMT